MVGACASDVESVALARVELVVADLAGFLGVGERVLVVGIATVRAIHWPRGRGDAGIAGIAELLRNATSALSV